MLDIEPLGPLKGSFIHKTTRSLDSHTLGSHAICQRTLLDFGGGEEKASLSLVGPKEVTWSLM